MVSDRQVKRLWRLAQKLSVEAAAAKSGMDSKTARKYLRDRKLPSEMREKHTWRTRLDPFADTWEEIRELLLAEPELQPKTLFEHLQRTYPARFRDGQVRTLRRRIKFWRQRKGRRARSSSRKNTSLVSYANPTSRIVVSWASPFKGRHFRI